MAVAPQHPPIPVKRYARSRLYDTTAGRYLRLADLRERAAAEVRSRVADAETGDDVTQVLIA